MSKKRCEFFINTDDKVCNKKINLYLQPCKSCTKDFCRQHFHIEAHNCEKLKEFKESSRMMLQKTLESGQANFAKVVKI